MNAIARTVFKKTPVAAPLPVAVPAASSSNSDTAPPDDAAIDLEHHDDNAEFADIDDGDDAGEFVAAEPVVEDDDYRMLSIELDKTDDNDVDEDDDDDLGAGDAAPVGAKPRNRQLHPAAQALRDFEAKVIDKRANFLLVLGTLQKLSVHDRPRSMMRVIRIADKLGSVTPRQRMRMRYTLVAHHIMHYRYDKALAMLQTAEDLTVIDASLSAVIVLLETRKTAEADKFALQIDALMTAADCRFSPESLNALLLIHINRESLAEASATYARLINAGLPLESDALTAYMRALAFSVPESALTVGYRARRDGMTITGLMYTSMIRACLDLNQLPRAVALFDMGVREGVRHTSATFAWLLEAFIQLRDEARVDEFVAWSRAQNAPMTIPMYDVIIRRALNRNDLDDAQQLIAAATDGGFLVDGGRFAELVLRLLATDQRRQAQQFLRAIAPKMVTTRQVLFEAVKAVASAFGREWNEAVDWLHEMRDLGVRLPPQLFAIAAAPLKNDVEGSRAFIALMREQRVPLVREHYGVALRNCAHDCDATVALFREMLEVDGLVPDSAALAALVTAYVARGRRMDALRAVRSTVRLAAAPPSVHYDDRVIEPLLSAAPIGEEAERTEFQLDASGRPSLERALQITGERLRLQATLSFQVHLGQLAAEQRQFNFIKSQVASVESTFPADMPAYHDAVMRTLLAPSKYDSGDSVRRAAEVAMQLFERAHKLALLRSPLDSGLVAVRRVTAFRDNCFNRVPPPLEAIHVGTLGDAVQAIMLRPVAQPMSAARSMRMWNNAMRACDIAGLKVQRAALEADWKLVSASLK